jgi:chromosome segregation ATPase
MKIFGKQIDNKIIAIVILSFFLLLETGAIFYGKNHYDGTIAKLDTLLSSIKSDNKRLTEQFDAAISRIAELEKSNTELNTILSRLREENNRSLASIREISAENLRINDKLNYVGEVAARITSTSASAEDTVRRIVELVIAIQKALGG